MYYAYKLLSNRKIIMQGRYGLRPRQALLCRYAGTIFLLTALSMVLVVVVAGLTPGASPYCGEGGCFWKSQPTILLSEEVRVQVGASPVAQRTFEAYVARPNVRLALASIDAIYTGPFAVLLFCVGVALRRLGGSGADVLGQALSWLRRASIAAFICALTHPIYESLLETLLSAGTPTGAKVQIAIYLGDIGTILLLAIAAYATIWAIEAGLRAQRDLDNFV